MNSQRQTFLWIFLFIFAGLTAQAQDIVAEDFFATMVTDCNEEARICLDIPLEDVNNYTFQKDGEVFEPVILGCDLDTIIKYSYADLFGQGEQGPYMLNNWTVNGQPLSGQFMNIGDLVSMMNTHDPAGAWSQHSESSSIEGGVASSTYSNMEITVMMNQTPAVLGYNLDINAEGISIPFQLGEHAVTVTDINTSATDMFTVSVMCQPNTNTVFLELTEGETETVCLDFSELWNEEVAGVAVDCQAGADATADFDLVNSGTCVEVTALAAGQESVCYIAVDALGNRDTTHIDLTVTSVSTSSFTHTDIIPANQEVYQLCLDTMELQGNVVSIENICEEESGDFVSFTIDEETYCVKYAGLECEGTETACIIVCDDLAVCDTTYLEITVDNTVCQPQPDTIPNTIYQGQSLLYCLDTDELPGTEYTLASTCEAMGFADFVIVEETLCVEYTGVSVGDDFACFVLTDDLGNTDTTYFDITVITPSPSIVTDLLIIEENEEYCPGTDELPGSEYEIFNICEESSGENVLFEIDDVSLCVNATALSIGTDTACIVICDENWICDTTYYYISVEEDNPSVNNLPPVAVDDELSTTENSPVVINVLGNDTIPAGSQIVVYSLPQPLGGAGPLNGTTEDNADGTITYTPDDDFCGEDMFNYVVCNQYGCDTALVVVNIECENVENPEVLVRSGFSPDGDNINDFFTVTGIENYPDNTVKIINRWGNVVYDKVGYRNDWDGTWEGELLPDGTYFYFVEIENVGKFNGYVEIRR